MVIHGRQLLSGRFQRQPSGYADYFNTLPKYVQENIKQSSVQPQNLQELQQCADNLMRRS